MLVGEGVQGLVTIIVPLYNRAKLICGMLDSVKSQIYRPIELIIVDDGSTDGGGTLAEQWGLTFGEPDFSVRVLRQSNRGAPAARNAGLRESGGEFIQFFDSDDRMTRFKLCAQIAALQSERAAGFAFSEVTSSKIHDMPGLLARLDSSKNSIDRFVPVSGAAISASIARGVLRRSSCREVGPWTESLTRYQDWEYSVRYVACGRLSLASAGIGFVTGLHDGPRIKDESANSVDNLQLISNAAESALSAITSSSHGGKIARIKIAQLYSFGLLAALDAGQDLEAAQFMSRIRRLTPLYHQVRTKNEIYFQIARGVGVWRLKQFQRLMSALKKTG